MESGFPHLQSSSLCRSHHICLERDNSTSWRHSWFCQSRGSFHTAVNQSINQWTELHTDASDRLNYWPSFHPAGRSTRGSEHGWPSEQNTPRCCSLQFCSRTPDVLWDSCSVSESIQSLWNSASVCVWVCVWITSASQNFFRWLK